jgi:tetratricopeptide (TPR) repeat protein
MRYPGLKYLFTMLFAAVFIMALPTGCQRQESNKPQGRQQTPAVVVNKDIPLANESAYVTVLRKLKNDPDNLEAIYHLGDLYYRDGDYEKAVVNFRRVLEQEPDRGYLYLKLGTALNRMQRYPEALEALTKAVANLQNPVVAYNNMGITYGKLGRFQEEIEVLEKAIKLRPRYASARYNLGVTLLKVGDVDGARLQYQALNEFDLTMARALQQEIEKSAPAADKR